MSNAFVGRTVELALLRTALDRGCVVALRGDPGIGKTRLLEELAADAERRGFPVLAGRAAEFEREVPFGTVRNALAEHFDEAASGEFLPAERYRVYRAVRGLLERTAAGRGLVLLLDDVHWSDEGSLELLDHLLRHPPRGRVVVAFAYRPRQAPERLVRSVEDAVRRGVATALDVGPLTFGEAGALMPAAAGPGERHRLYEASGGNPFHLEILVRGSGRSTEILPALAPTPRTVLHAAAVAGDGADPGLLAAVAEMSTVDTLAALDHLAAHDLIRPDGPRGFRFRHPLVRAAAYEHAGPGWRVAAHARAAAELARRGAPVTDRAVHVQASARVGELSSVELLLAAATEAMRATPATAAHWLHTALGLLPDGPQNIGKRLALLHLRAQALGYSGRLADSRELLEQILRLLPEGSPPRVGAVTFLTMLQHLLGEHAEARALLRRELATQTGEGADVLRVALALTHLMPGDADDTAVEAAIATARDTGNRGLLLGALSKGAMSSQAFDVDDARPVAWLDEAAELADAMPDTELAGRLDDVVFLGLGELYRERFRAALRHIRRASDVSRATGQSHLIGSLQMIEGVLYCDTGDFRAALAVLDDALESVLLTGGRSAHSRVQGYRCWATLWTGDVATANALGEEAVALTTGAGRADWQPATAEGMLGWARYAAGDLDGCAEVLLSAGGGPDLPAIRPVWQPRWYEVLAAAAAAAGDHRRAGDMAARAARLAVAPGLSRRAGMIAVTQVHAALASDPAAAAEHAGRAATLFTRAGDRAGAARARTLLAAAYQALGKTEESAREAEAARRGFARCGAAPDWLFRAAGIPLAADPVPLTRREQEVLAHLAQSLTAAAIARRLGISTGTVHKHLAAVYRKLGTGDRLATVLRARELGLIPD
ncbi:hypothetical protein Val02_04440 [Virgisporangium aliadipatigenens]|uniref:HTH luxR-type domain-containing protein n=1 Tax=Virgisporangium aliadipatigenens TaxID=741659 RepID=A0A8J4DNG7_9ACTN|nr:AAA family ATPase [Virgisporangium aliadipatigenens]GIJ43558.1 hypothetical protein Val02_04440 [Virgisporangium aliadipatigenens]